MKRLIDSFTFFNEAEICELRLRVLDRVVDKFVVVEADATFSGRSKPYNFPALLHARLQPWREKIVYHPMHLDVSGIDFDTLPTEFDPAAPQWALERSQRNAIDEACRAFDEDDWLVISDVDEIPHPEFLRAVLTNEPIVARLPIALQQFVFYYKLSNLREEGWRGSVVTTVGKSRALTAQWHREARWDLDNVDAAGWHLSYFGDVQRIRTKLESFSHQEYNRDDVKSTENIEQSRVDGRDLLGREVGSVKVDESFFPPFFLEAAERERDFFW